MKKLQLEALSLEVPELSPEVCKRLLGGNYGELVDGGEIEEIYCYPDETLKEHQENQKQEGEQERHEQQQDEDSDKEQQGEKDTPEENPNKDTSTSNHLEGFPTNFSTQVGSLCVYTSFAAVATFLGQSNVNSGNYVMSYMGYANTTLPDAMGGVHGEHLGGFIQSVFDAPPISDPANAIDNEHAVLAYIIDSNDASSGHEVVIIGYEERDGVCYYQYWDPETGGTDEHEVSHFHDMYEIFGVKT
ncbi:MAG: hypothetical protein LBK47_01190 [Prevotellaceae bacterium]|jgi:hypothetical protein|nr:hypothetical protein [Prevotellaceae bacterium]